MLEREVDDAVCRRRSRTQAVQVVEGSAVDLGSRGGHGRGRGVGTGEPEDLMARADELGDDGGADEAGRTGDEHAHDNLQVAGGTRQERAGRP